MALQDALEKIEEYNAAIELPNAGLLGIGAYTAHPPALRIAKRELRTCIHLSITAQKALSSDKDALRRNPELYSAFREIFQRDRELKEFLRMLQKMNETFELLIRKLEGKRVRRTPTKEELDEISERLHNFSDRIRQAIPRDVYLSSLTGRTQPILSSGRS